MAAVLGLSSAQAQDKTAGEKANAEKSDDGKTVVLETFQVTGLQNSIRESTEIKRASMPIMDSIVAEDIGKFPDNNVVEALQRLPGIQVTNYSRGHISGLSIRGLPDPATTVNGRNIFTGTGRSVALQDIPASLLRQADVFKTRSASMLESGLAGVIDVKTWRPFDFKGDITTVTAKGIYEEQADKYSPNVSGMISRRWDTSAGKFGALLSFGYTRNNYRDQSVTPGAMVPFMTNTPAAGFGAYERVWPTPQWWQPAVSENPIWQPGLEDGLKSTAGSTFKINGVTTPYVLSRDAIFQSDATGFEKHPAANLVLQYSPNKDAEYTFEVLYNGYRNENFNSLLFSFADAWWANGANPASTITLHPGTNIVKARSLVGDVFSFTSGDYSTGKTDGYLYGLNAKWNISPDFTLRADASYQETKFENTFFAMRFNKSSRKDLWVDFNRSGGVPAWGFSDDPSTTTMNESNNADVNQWGGAELYDNGGRDNGNASTLKLDGTYRTAASSFFKSFDFGVRWDDHRAHTAYRVSTPAGFVNQSVASLNSSYPGFVDTNSNFFDGRADVPSSWIVASGPYIAAHADTFRALAGLPKSDKISLHETFRVQEITSAAYVQSKFETSVLGRKLDGEIGVRYVNVQNKMSSTSYNEDRLSATPWAVTGTASSSTSKSKLLPTVMIRYDLTDKLKARLSYCESLRPPGFGEINPLIGYNPDVSNIGYRTAGGGNQNLKATESKNYDLSLEYYWDDVGAVIFGTAFERDINGLVVSLRKRIRYNNIDYILTQPDNASNGKLKGFEFGANYFPKGLPSFLDGLGFIASCTSLSSSQDIPLTNDVGTVVGTKNTKFFGVSDFSYNAILAYEYKKKLSIRLGYTWREGFLDRNEAALFANPIGIYNSAERNLSLSVSYNITRDFTLTFEGRNLTNDIFHSHYGSAAGAETINNFGNWIVGRQFAVGARYAF